VSPGVVACTALDCVAGSEGGSRDSSARQSALDGNLEERFARTNVDPLRLVERLDDE
jgi:hypothetical protein